MDAVDKDIIVYKETDIIECPVCYDFLLFSELVPKEGHEFQNNTHTPWRSMYYYCECNNENVLVYDPGDGSNKRLIKGKIVRP